MAYSEKMNPSSRPSRIPFLLTQLGTVAADGFAERTRAIGLSPSEAGVLRLVSRDPGISQRALAERLQTQPSRVVALIDRLESEHLVSRTRSAVDRRNYELELTAAGRTTLAELRTINSANETALLDGLTTEDLAQLGALLEKLARARGLDPDVHPGYAQSQPE